MSGFKLLAIRPLKDCGKQYMKVLKEGQIYQFYHDYEFEKEDNSDIHSHVSRIEHKSQIPEDLYNIGKLEVSISAVVGRNGSGKSSLIEFLYYLIYILGNKVRVSENNMEPKPMIKTYPDKMMSEIKWRIKEIRKSKCITSKVRRINEIIRQLPTEKDRHAEIMDNFRGSVYYLMNGVYYELRVNNGTKIDTVNVKSNQHSKDARDIKVINILQNLDGFQTDILNHFFYTVSINYSHYALNSNFIGNWINTLFHKNDGYKTPAVINPMRTEGNYDINEEMIFAKYRLLSNVLIEKLKQVDKKKEIYITDRQYVKTIRFTYNKRKLKERKVRDTGSELSGVKFNNREVNLLMDLYSNFFPGSSLIDLRNNPPPFLNEVGNYIIQKIDQIINTYDLFSEGYNFDIRIDNQNERIKFIQKILEHPSHVVFKLKQALNFLFQNLNYLIQMKPAPWFDYFDTNPSYTYEFSIVELLDWMEVSEVSEVFNHLPPSIFDIDFTLGNNIEEKSNLSDLSSGEQQMIHSMQSAIYHINNLESIHSRDDNPVRYENINIIYDEIELYFHPDFQREFILKLRETLERLDLGKNKKGIKSINVLFSTHSPFILSDIPASNILRLEIGKDGKSYPQEIGDKTFGANIHDLLANDFFMTEGFMGKFAKNRISGLINRIEKVEENSKDIELYKNISAEINIIGEPVLLNSLQSMLDTKFEKVLVLNKREEELIIELENVRNQKSK